MRHHANKSRGGYTVVELALSIGLLLLLVGAPVRFMDTAANVQSELDRVTNLNARAARVMERVTERLQGAGPSQVTPAATPLGTQSIDFRVATGFAGGAITWDVVERIEFDTSPTDPVDGIDNDGDGLIDEGRVLWTRNGDVRVLCENVAQFAEGEIPGNAVDDNGNNQADEAGFSMTIETAPVQRVRVFLTLADMTPEGDLIQATIEQSIALRCRKP